MRKKSLSTEEARPPPSRDPARPLPSRERERRERRGNRWELSNQSNYQGTPQVLCCRLFMILILGGDNAAWNASGEARRAKTARTPPPPAWNFYVSGPTKDALGKTAAAQQQRSGEAATPANSSPGGVEQHRSAPLPRLPKKGAREANQCRTSPTIAPPPVPQEPAATAGPRARTPFSGSSAGALLV